jgi:hypothetical protein
MNTIAEGVPSVAAEEVVNLLCELINIPNRRVPGEVYAWSGFGHASAGG